MKYKKIAFASAFLLASLIPQLQADFYSWLGTTDDVWSNNLNWQNETIPGPDDTARIFNSGVTMAPPAVLSGSASVTQVWLGNIGGPSESGALTVVSGASLTTSGDFIIADNSTLSSSGAISVGNVNGLIARNSADVTLRDGSTLNKLRLENDSTATMEAGSTVDSVNLAQNSHLTMNSVYTGNISANSGSSVTINGTVDGNLDFNTTGTGLIGENGTVTGNLGINRTASVTVNGTVDGRININQDSSLTLNGTCAGDFKHNSTAMAYINEGATVSGNAEFDNDDQVTIAGNINGAGKIFFVKGNAAVTILPTANILSDGNNSWIYDTPTITWKVGADGSIGTLKTSRLEPNAGQFDGEWRYSSSEVVLVVDLTDCVVYGSDITLQLVSDIQDEETFASKVTFLNNGEDVTSDFTWDGENSGSFTGSIANPEPDDDGDGLANSVETNTGIFVDASDTGTNPNLVDTDGDGLSDAVETGTGVYVSATDTGSNPNLDDTDGDGLSDAVETGTGVYVSSSDTGTNRLLADSDGDTMSDFDEIQYMGLDPNTDSSTLISSLPSTGGGLTEQDLIDLRVGSQLASIANEEATLQVVIEQSDNLGSWSTVKTESVTVPAPAGTTKQFSRYRMQD